MWRGLLLVLFGLASLAHAQPLRFSATGCGPYADDEEPLLAHYVDLVNNDGQSEFLVHLGDVVTGAKRQWPETQYAKVANILKRSEVPAYVVLGDNEWNDLENPAEGLEFWNRQLRDFDKNFPHSHKLAKQKARPENFAFVSKCVLIIGLNLVGGRVHDKNEWETRHKQNADWVTEQFAAHQDVRAAVILAQARPAKEHETFFKAFTDACVQWNKPVLYLHADGHVWQVEQGWRAPNILRVQTDQVRLNPPVLVTVTEDPKEPFQFDRRLDIASRRELFVDDFLIDELRDVSYQLHKPTAHDVVITCDAPWEGNTSAYFTLLDDHGLFRMYYRASHFDEATKKGAHPEFTAYAESRDGLHFTKPKLGLVEFNGSKENNVILAGESTHNFTPFLDANPAASADARFKALAGGKKGLKAYKSADGIHWSLMQDQPVITDGDFDSQNLAFWHAGQKRYLAYHRKGNNRIRDIMFSTSTDFIKWSEPKFLAYGDAPVEHLYTNAIRTYAKAPHLFIGFPTRFQPKTQQVEPILMTSRDGMNFKRWAEELIPITAPANRDGNRSNYMTNSLLSLPGKPSELSLYATEAYYTGPGSRVRRFSLREDGFASLHADQTVGEMLSKQLTFAGDNLKVNYATTKQGRVRFELQGADGKAIAGFALADCEPLSGDSIAGPVNWSGGSLSRLQNVPVRLRVEMQNADLFAIQFGTK